VLAAGGALFAAAEAHAAVDKPEAARSALSG
jgi:hypothetical protein